MLIDFTKSKNYEMFKHLMPICVGDIFLYSEDEKYIVLSIYPDDSRPSEIKIQFNTTIYTTASPNSWQYLKRISPAKITKIIRKTNPRLKFLD